jgi:hypothetical protein
MKQNDDFCQICGVLCLKELIINLNFYLNNSKYMKYLWEKLILFIENDNFGNKIFLLQCLNELIKKCKEKFKQFANITMYKILDFLQDNENDLRKEALNILYFLIFHCPKDISSLKNQLIDFISVLQEEKDEFIQNKCNQILTLLNDNNDKLNESNKIISSDSKRNYSENNELRNKINKMKKDVKKLSENKLNNTNNESNINNNNNSNINDSQKLNKYLKKEKESIFKTPKNKDFFDKANKIDDIYIVDSLHNQNYKFNNSIENDNDNLNNISLNYNYRKFSKDYSYHSNNNNTINTNSINNNNYTLNTNNKNNYYMISSDSNNLESGNKKNIILENKNKNDEYTQLIHKMKDLSEKQIVLIDCLTQFKNDFFNVTSDLNNRIERLEKIISNGTPNLTNQSVNFNNTFNYKNNNFSINNYKNLNNYINDPIQNLVDENNLNSLLINLTKFTFEDLNEIPIQTLENVIYYFINKIQNEQNIPIDKIISILKKIMIGLKNKIANDCKENLEYTLKQLLNDLNMKEDNVIEIKLILSYLKN